MSDGQCQAGTTSEKRCRHRGLYTRVDPSDDARFFRVCKTHADAVPFTHPQYYGESQAWGTG